LKPPYFKFYSGDHNSDAGGGLIEQWRKRYN
jgi:hypothetical protein